MFVKRSLLCFAFLVCAVSVASGQPNNRQSLYSRVDPQKCRNLKSSGADAGDYVGRCGGIAGFSLIVTEGDLRQNVTVVTPRGTKHSLELWSVVSPAFSSLGPTVEWRVDKRVPAAIIVRYNASENPEKPDKKTSYLVVAKITAGEICVTDKIPPGPKANEEARRLADESATKPCLKSQN